MKKTVRFCLLVVLLFVCMTILVTNVAYATEENIDNVTTEKVEIGTEDDVKTVVPASDLVQDSVPLSSDTLKEVPTATDSLPAVDATAEIVATTPMEDATVPDQVSNVVAKIGDSEYATLDEAVAAANDGDTITVLKDCTTDGLNLSKNITIEGSTGSETITFTKYGIALWGKTLTFRNVNVIMTGIGSTPYTAEWNWMTICASKNAVLNLENATMTIDGTGQDKHCIYFCSNNKLNITNSTLIIRNYVQDALEWDGGDGGYNVNIVNSTFISDHNRSGFTGTFYATIDNSTVNVINSLGNGSNGTYYTIKNNSNVLFDGNGNWGISAWRIDMTNNSTLTATNNGYSGIWTRVLNVDSTCTLDVERNGAKATGFTTNAGIFFQGNGTYKSVIEKGANVTIKDNAGSGIYTKQTVCDLTILSGTITNNGTGLVNTNNGKGATYGGGIYNVGTMVIGEDVIIYNNHADTAGDDIYSTKVITFGTVGSDWYLDGAPDCYDQINGWYDDAEGTRWDAHNKDTLHYVLMNNGTVEGNLAIKAAHDLIVKDIDVIFRVENGTWEDGTTDDITVTYHVVELTENVIDEEGNVVLDENGNPQTKTVKYAVTINEDGTITILDDDVKLLESDVPTNMKPNTGYENGNWNKNDYTLENNGVYSPNTKDYLSVDENPYEYVYNFTKKTENVDTDVVNNDQTVVTSSATGLVTNPGTGDHDYIYVALLVLAIIAGVAISVKKSRI